MYPIAGKGIKKFWNSVKFNGLSFWKQAFFIGFSVWGCWDVYQNVIQMLSEKTRVVPFRVEKQESCATWYISYQEMIFFCTTRVSSATSPGQKKREVLFPARPLRLVFLYTEFFNRKKCSRFHRMLVSRWFSVFSGVKGRGVKCSQQETEAWMLHGASLHTQNWWKSM